MSSIVKASLTKCSVTGLGLSSLQATYYQIPAWAAGCIYINVIGYVNYKFRNVLVPTMLLSMGISFVWQVLQLRWLPSGLNLLLQLLVARNSANQLVLAEIRNLHPRGSLVCWLVSGLGSNTNERGWANKALCCFGICLCCVCRRQCCWRPSGEFTRHSLHPEADAYLCSIKHRRRRCIETA